MKSRLVTTAIGSPLSLVSLVSNGMSHSRGRVAVIAKTTAPLLGYRGVGDSARTERQLLRRPDNPPVVGRKRRHPQIDRVAGSIRKQDPIAP